MTQLREAGDSEYPLCRQRASIGVPAFYDPGSGPETISIPCASSESLTLTMHSENHVIKRQGVTPITGRCVKTLVSKTEIRPVQSAETRRTGQMKLHSRQQRRIARRGAEFRPGNLLHGFDHGRKPRPFALSGAPLPRLLDHRLLLALAAARPDQQPVHRKPVPGPCRKKDRPNVSHFTNHPGLSVLNRRNDPESTPTCVSAVRRSPRRLRPDRRQRCRRPDRADLPHPGLNRVRGGRARHGKRTVSLYVRGNTIRFSSAFGFFPIR
jgi:hypothetical protein